MAQNVQRTRFMMLKKRLETMADEFNKFQNELFEITKEKNFDNIFYQVGTARWTIIEARLKKIWELMVETFPQLFGQLNEIQNRLQDWKNNGQLRYYHLKNVGEFAREILDRKNRLNQLSAWNPDFLAKPLNQFIETLELEDPCTELV